MKKSRDMNHPKRQAPLLRLWHYATRHRRRFYLATLCSVLNKFFDLAPPVLIGAAVDIVVRREDSILSAFGFVEVQVQLIVLSGLTFVIWGLESLSEYLYAVLWRNLAQTIQPNSVWMPTITFNIWNWPISKTAVRVD